MTPGSQSVFHIYTFCSPPLVTLCGRIKPGGAILAKPKHFKFFFFNQFILLENIYSVQSVACVCNLRNGGEACHGPNSLTTSLHRQQAELPVVRSERLGLSPFSQLIAQKTPHRLWVLEFPCHTSLPEQPCVLAGLRPTSLLGFTFTQHILDTLQWCVCACVCTCVYARVCVCMGKVLCCCYLFTDIR